MADGIYDIDINKLLGINPTLPQGLLENDPNLATDAFSKQIFGGLEGLTQAQQNYAGTPETILRTLLGMKTGRQAAYDAATKRYQTRQDILKDQLGIKKVTGELEMQPYQKRELMLNIGDKENKFYESSIRAKSIKRQLMQLEEQGRYAELDRYAQNPDEFIKLEAAADIRNKVFDDDTISAAMSIGLNPNNRDSWREQDWANLDILLQAPDAKEANELNLKNRQAHAADRSNVPLVQIKDRNTLAKEMRIGGRNVTLIKQQNGQAQQQSNEPVDLEFYNPTFEELQKGKINAGTDPRFPEGVIFGSDGVNYTQAQWDAMGENYRRARRKGLERKTQVEFEEKVNDNAAKAGGMNEYLFRNIDKTNRIIEEIVSKPEFLEDLASVGGRAITNLNLGKYGFTSDVQDIQNLFNLVKNQQFINEIQNMRANNPTGGAVGNVSDFEVKMFMNAAAALQEGGSAKFMYNELKRLHEFGKRGMKEQQKKYRELYGDNNASINNFDYYSADSYVDIPEWNAAISQSGQNKTLKKNITVRKLED